MTDSKAPKPDRDTRVRPGDSILDSIARRAGRAPHVNLRDAGTGGEAPIIDPKAHAFQNELSLEDQGKYRILGEIARGGMGVILRGHDVELGRDIAIKVTDSKLAKRPEVVERFIEEAQIGGQLQHPGIVPVYELGLMADQRPYFTMKLIKGRTLAAMLTRRKSSDEDRVRFLGIWESVCQTMAYAHSKGVIHRDLKPANIMVGAFGEVQVVDWGLSKVLRRGGVEDEIEARDTALSVIETVRSGPGSGSDSLVGNVLGTPAYMSPEQAQGEPDKLDERTDVFALGAILCEILTGAPPYVAGEGENLVQMAALGELDDARKRIEACAASQDLKKLCLTSLLTSRAARPRDAEELALAIHQHLSGLETRAHDAQLAAADEKLRAEQSRRRSQILVMAGVVLIIAAGSWWFIDQQQREREAELSASFFQLQAEAQQHVLNGNFAQAVELANSGLVLVDAGDGNREVRTQAKQLVASTQKALLKEEQRLDKLQREEELFDFLLDVEMRQVRTGFSETDEQLDAQYAQAFRDYGIDFEKKDMGAILLAERDTDLGVRLALGFDGWSRLLRRMGSDRNYDIQLLTGIGMDLDTNPLRTQVRLALVERNSQKLRELAQGLDVATTAPETLALLGTSLSEFNHMQEARSLFVRGANQYPTNFLLNFGAGNLLARGMGNQASNAYSNALGFLRAALTLRPDLVGLHVLLGDLYNNHGNKVLAHRHLKIATSLAPDHTWNEAVIGWMHLNVGDYEGAIEWLERDAESGNPSRSGGAGLFASKVALGLATIDEFIVWGEQLGDEKWFAKTTPAMALLAPGFARVTPDPERARLILEGYLPEGMPSQIYWSMLAFARTLTGDAVAARTALARGSEHVDYDFSDWSFHAEDLLQRAILLRLEGKHDLADESLEEARWLRRELTTGLEEEWSNTRFVLNFDYLEKFATK